MKKIMVSAALAAAVAGALAEIKPSISSLTETRPTDTKRKGRWRGDARLSPAQRVIERAKARRKHLTSGD